MKILENGTYKGVIVDHGIHKTGKGPMAVIQFDIAVPEEQGGGVKKLAWFGSFNGGAREITVRTLVDCGFKGENGKELVRDRDESGECSSPLMLDGETTFDLVVENEFYNDKEQTRIRWINLPGAGGKFNNVDTSEAATLMGGLNLKGDFMKARAGKKEAAAPAAAPAVEESGFTEDDIPF